MTDRKCYYSIRRRLLVGLLTATALTWLVALVFSYLDTRHELDELLDAHLAQSASLLLAQIGHEVEDIEIENAPALHRYSRNVAFQVWYRGNRLVLHSAGAPDTLLSAQREGFSDSIIKNRKWRVFSASDTRGRYLVQVAEQRHARDELLETVVGNMLLPVLIVLPVMGALIWFGISRGLRPLNTISNEVAQRQPENLSPLALHSVPDEIAPLVRDLNRLFDRVRESLDKERRFTADAAHELRTPLAAIKTQAQVAQASTDDDERRQSLTKVIEGCDRATRLVEQLLTLARLEPENYEANESCELRSIAQQVIAELAPDAVARNIELNLLAEEEANVKGVAALLGILVRNLVDNAVRYSPANSEVQIRIDSSADRAILNVCDQGPGIPEGEKERIWDRFYRVLGTGETGSGLGLSIVRQIADLHHADIETADGKNGKGLCVSVKFDTCSR
jgi:two-component system sensor histidine kinase QseC